MLHSIDSRLPSAPDVSLLTSAFPLPPGSDQFDQWRTGFSARNLACLSATSEAGYCPGDQDRWEAPEPTVHEFRPLVTYLTHGCEGHFEDADRWKLEARAALEARLPYAVARELWTGEKSGSESLQSTAIVSTTSGLSPTSGVLSALADYEECTQGAPAFIHAPSVLYQALVTNGFTKRVGNTLVTETGHRLILGPGYPNDATGDWGPHSDPDDPESAYLGADEGEVWVYVSSPVEVSKPVFNPTQKQDVEFHEVRKNRIVVVPEMWTIARFDTCCVFAARVTVPDLEN